MLPGVSPCARVWLVLIKCTHLALDIFIPRVARVWSGIRLCRCAGDTQCGFTWVGAPVRSPQVWHLFHCVSLLLVLLLSA